MSLRCVRCESMNSLENYNCRSKYLNLEVPLPTCRNCSTSFKIWKAFNLILKILNYTIWSIFIILIILFIFPFSIRYLPIILILGILVLVIVGIIRRLLNSLKFNPNKYISFSRIGVLIKSKKTITWMPFENWKNKSGEIMNIYNISAESWRNNRKTRKNLKIAAEKLIQDFTSKKREEFLKILVKESIVFPRMFWDRLYPILRKNFLKKFPKEEILNLDKDLVWIIFIQKERNEKIHIGFPGTLNLPDIKVIAKGIIFFTNLRMVVIPFKFKESHRGEDMMKPSVYDKIYAGSTIRLAETLVTAPIAIALAKKFKKRAIFYNKLLELYKQTNLNRPYVLYFVNSIPYLVPYNLKIRKQTELSFMMNYEYFDNNLQKILKMKFKITPTQIESENTKDYIQRREEIFSKIRDLFSQFHT